MLISICIEDDVEVKRAFIFALLFGFENKAIDTVRTIPKGELNSHIRKIPITELLNHQNDSHRLNKRWRYLRKSTVFRLCSDRRKRVKGGKVFIRAGAPNQCERYEYIQDIWDAFSFVKT